MAGTAGLMSMTGFATRRGAGAGASWAWDLRGVNGKGLELRLRLPEGVEGLEPAVRAALQKALGRGNIGLTLRVVREAGEAMARPNPAALRSALAALAEVRAEAERQGLVLAPATAGEILALRGVLETGAPEEDGAALREALMTDLPGLLADFAASRAAEGAALAALIGAQIDRIEALAADARGAAAARAPQAAEALRAALARVTGNADGVDETRLAQELALIAVKGDVTEELDRLDAHIAAARALVAEGGAVGRRLDFLMQEFMREANTLCSKAQDIALTRAGLDLKTVIDQMREQVQNVE